LALQVDAFFINAAGVGHEAVHFGHALVVDCGGVINKSFGALGGINKSIGGKNPDGFFGQLMPGRRRDGRHMQFSWSEMIVGSSGYESQRNFHDFSSSYPMVAGSGETNHRHSTHSDCTSEQLAIRTQCPLVRRASKLRCRGNMRTSAMPRMHRRRGNLNSPNSWHNSNISAPSRPRST